MVCVLFLIAQRPNSQSVVALMGLTECQVLFLWNRIESAPFTDPGVSDQMLGFTFADITEISGMLLVSLTVQHESH